MIQERLLNIDAVVITLLYSLLFAKMRPSLSLHAGFFMAELRDVWSTTHFITSEQIVNWLQGNCCLSPRLTQTVNPHLWLTVMIPRKVSRVVTNEVSLGPGRRGGPRKAQNTQNQIKQISLSLTLELVQLFQTVQSF